MKKQISTLIFLLNSLAFGQAKTNARPHLGDFDLKVYQNVQLKCSGGSVSSAMQIGFDLENLNSSIENSLKIVSLDFADAIMARLQSGGMSPQVAAIRRSPGFWLALMDCYGYKYGELNRGNLMKQIIDFGHLSTEVTGVMAGVSFVKVGVLSSQFLSEKFPLASRFVTAGLLSLLGSQLINHLYWSHSVSMTEADREKFDSQKKQIFSEPDRVIREVVKSARIRLIALEDESLNPNLDPNQKNAIHVKIETIKKSLENIYSLNPSLKNF